MKKLLDSWFEICNARETVQKLEKSSRNRRSAGILPAGLVEPSRSADWKSALPLSFGTVSCLRRAELELRSHGWPFCCNPKIVMS